MVIAWTPLVVDPADADSVARRLPEDKITLSDLDPRRQLIALLPELRGYARFLVGQPSEADDLVQDCLLRALGALDQFSAKPTDAVGSLRAWTFTILRNTFFEQSRRRRTERAAIVQSVSHASPDDEAGAPRQIDQLAVSDLQRQLFCLPPLLREALVLVGAQGLTYEEAAVICAVPVGTMKARVSRARRQLAADLPMRTEALAVT